MSLYCSTTVYAASKHYIYPAWEEMTKEMGRGGGGDTSGCQI